MEAADRHSTTRHFALRAASYEDYTVWLRDERVLSEILKPLNSLHRDAICVDVGSGTGAVARAGEQIAGKWTAVDISQEMLVAGRRGRRVVGDAKRLPLRSESIDFVSVRSVASYIDPLTIFGEVRRVLARDGVVVLAEKVIGDYIGSAAEWYRRVQSVRNPLKADPFDSRDLVALAQRAGLDVLSCVELRRSYRQPVSDWLSRSGTIPTEAGVRLLELLRNAPDEAREIGLSVDGDSLTLPLSWAILTAQKGSPRAGTSLVVTAVPLRLAGGLVQVYVQNRRAAYAKEPEFFEYFEFPQGHVEDEESIHEALRRELAEEAGLDVEQVLDPFDDGTLAFVGDVSTEAIYPTMTVRTRGRLNFTSLVFFVLVREGIRSGPFDNSGRWVGADSLSAIIDDARVYPLNVPMFTMIAQQLPQIEAKLIDIAGS